MSHNYKLGPTILILLKYPSLHCRLRSLSLLTSLLPLLKLEHAAFAHFVHLNFVSFFQLKKKSPRFSNRGLYEFFFILRERIILRLPKYLRAASHTSNNNMCIHVFHLRNNYTLCKPHCARIFYFFANNIIVA